MDSLVVFAYRFAVWFVPLLPEQLGYWLFARLGDLAYILSPGTRAAHQKNLRPILGTETPQAEYDRITRKALQHLLKNYFDLFRGHRMTQAQVLAQLETLQGFEYIQEGLARGKGLVGGSAHFGNFNMFVHLTAVHLKDAHEVIVPVERIKPEGAFEIVIKQRAAQGIELVPVDQAARVLLKKLRAGALVGLSVDLDVTRTGPIVKFFGVPARLPDGAPALALKYDAPLVLGFIRRLDNNKCAVVIEPPLELERTGDLAADTLKAVGKIVERLEYWIRKYPEQWLMFQPFWEQDKSVE